MGFHAHMIRQSSKPSRIKALERAGEVSGKVRTKPYGSCSQPHVQSIDQLSLTEQEIRYREFKSEEK